MPSGKETLLCLIKRRSPTPPLFYYLKTTRTPSAIRTYCASGLMNKPRAALRATVGYKCNTCCRFPVAFHETCIHA